MSYDFSKTLIRCHRSGDIMTNPQSKSALLSKTCESYLRLLYREKQHGTVKNIVSKYTDKGLSCEEDGITLHSRVNHKMFKKNEERIDGNFFTGIPDLYDGESIRKATHVYDIKSVWDDTTFPFPDDPINKDYMYQLQAYMSLTGADAASLVYCLVDTPEYLIKREIDSIKWRTGIEATEEQIAAIRKSMTFSDRYTLEERIVEYQISRDDALIKHMEQRVDLCRQYLVSLQNQMTCRK